MHVVVRWLMRHVILLFSEEWVNAHREVETMQAAYRIQALCDAELRVFKAALIDLERMQIEATRAKVRLPAARGLIDEMLQGGSDKEARDAIEISQVAVETLPS